MIEHVTRAVDKWMPGLDPRPLVTSAANETHKPRHTTTPDFRAPNRVIVSQADVVEAAERNTSPSGGARSAGEWALRVPMLEEDDTGGDYTGTTTRGGDAVEAELTNSKQVADADPGDGIIETANAYLIPVSRVLAPDLDAHHDADGRLDLAAAARSVGGRRRHIRINGAEVRVEWRGDTAGDAGETGAFEAREHMADSMLVELVARVIEWRRDGMTPGIARRTRS